MHWKSWIVIVPALLVIAVVFFTIVGTRRWNSATHRLANRLEAARIDESVQMLSPSHFDPRELDGLPAPVQRYFRTVLKEGQPIITAVNIVLTGKFNMSATGKRWKPFTSKQRVVTRRPGFLWDAQILMFPGVAVHVVDSYMAGEGLLRAAIMGLFNVANIQGDGEIARGEFMRFFAEAAWYPTALLPSQGVRWEAVDHKSANATIVDGLLSLTLLFRFNAEGLIDSFRAEARGSMMGKDMVLAPWEGFWSNYQMCNGMLLPFTGEVAWIRSEGRKPYFIGNVTSLIYEFSL